MEAHRERKQDILGRLYKEQNELNQLKYILSEQLELLEQEESSLTNILNFRSNPMEQIFVPYHTDNFLMNNSTPNNVSSVDENPIMANSIHTDSTMMSNVNTANLNEFYHPELTTSIEDFTHDDLFQLSMDEHDLMLAAFLSGTTNDDHNQNIISNDFDNNKIKFSLPDHLIWNNDNLKTNSLRNTAKNDPHQDTKSSTYVKNSTSNETSSNISNFNATEPRYTSKKQRKTSLELDFQQLF